MGLCGSVTSKAPAAIESIEMEVPDPLQQTTKPSAALAPEPFKPRNNTTGDSIQLGTTAEKTTLAQAIIGAKRGNSGKPTFSEVRRCFSDARAYYKGEVKSSNKFYYPLQAAQYNDNGKVKEVQTLTAGDSPKAKLRNDNVLQSRQMKEGGRVEGDMPLILGKNLYAAKAKYGNCGEMSAVAAYLLNERFPKEKLFWVIITPDHHEFFVCGAKPPVDKAVESWANHKFKSACYVTDVWMNICCEAKDYPSLVKQKLDKWTREGKGVFSGAWENTDKKDHVVNFPESGVIHTVANVPNSQFYSDTLLRSTTQIHPIN